MNRSDITQLITDSGLQTFTVYAVTDWTNRIVDHCEFVPPEGIALAANDLLFKAWDGEYQRDSRLFGQPSTCTVLCVPSDWREQAAQWDAKLAALKRESDIYLKRMKEIEDTTPTPDLITHPEYPYACQDAQVAYEQWLAAVDASPTVRRKTVKTNGRYTTTYERKSDHAIMSSFSRVVDSTVARPDGSPTPVMAIDPVDPIKPKDHQVLGPYSD